jgi:hypothetical protein
VEIWLSAGISSAVVAQDPHLAPFLRSVWTRSADERFDVPQTRVSRSAEVR